MTVHGASLCTVSCWANAAPPHALLLICGHLSLSYLRLQPLQLPGVATTSSLSPWLCCLLIGAAPAISVSAAHASLITGAAPNCLPA